MTSTILVHGVLFRDPERKVSRAGKEFVQATIREGSGDAAQWWRVFCFSESASAELMGLHDGDGVAVSGTFKAEVYEARDGMRLSLSVFADRAISAKQVKKERAQERKAEQPRPGRIDAAKAQRPLDGELNDPLPDGWPS